MYWWGKVESTDLVHYQQITPYAMTGSGMTISVLLHRFCSRRQEQHCRFRQGCLCGGLQCFGEDQEQAQGISSVMTERHFIIMKVTRFWTLEYGNSGTPPSSGHDPKKKMGDGCSQGPGEEKIKF